MKVNDFNFSDPVETFDTSGFMGMAIEKYVKGAPLGRYTGKSRFYRYSDSVKLGIAIENDDSERLGSLLRAIELKSGLDVARRAIAACYEGSSGGVAYRSYEDWFSMSVERAATNCIRWALENNMAKPYQTVFSSRHENLRYGGTREVGSKVGQSLRQMCWGGGLLDLDWVSLAKNSPEDWFLTLNGEKTDNWIMEMFTDCLYPGDMENRHGQTLIQLTGSDGLVWTAETYKSFLELNIVSMESILRLQDNFKEQTKPTNNIYSSYFKDWYNPELCAYLESVKLKHVIGFDRGSSSKIMARGAL